MSLTRYQKLRMKNSARSLTRPTKPEPREKETPKAVVKIETPPVEAKIEPPAEPKKKPKAKKKARAKAED